VWGASGCGELQYLGKSNPSSAFLIIQHFAPDDQTGSVAHFFIKTDNLGFL
jgi:hypothetical protein